MKRTTLALAALGALFAAQPAFAESVTISYKDLDLSTAAGQEKLDQRIDAAAKKVCGFNDLTTGTRIPTREARECIADARQKLEQRLATLTSKKVAGS